MYFSRTLRAQGNIQHARGCFSYSGYAILCLCQSYPPRQWQFLWSGCLRTSAFWSEFELYFIDKCLNVLYPITWAFQLIWVSFVWKEKKEVILCICLYGENNLGWWYMGLITFVSVLWCLFETDGDVPWGFCNSSCTAMKFSEFRSSGQSTLNMWVCYLHTDYCKIFSKV